MHAATTNERIYNGRRAIEHLKAANMVGLLPISSENRGRETEGSHGSKRAESKISDFDTIADRLGVESTRSGQMVNLGTRST